MPIHSDYHGLLDSLTEQYCDGETEETIPNQTAEGYPRKTCQKALSVFYALCNDRGWDYTKPMPAKESFSWVGDIRPDEKNLIRGQALHPIKTIHPEEWPSVRVYLEEELKKAAHTLAGAPLLLDHIIPIDGKVLAAEYEDGAIEYVAELNDERVLDWIRSGVIEQCSVEYDWRSLQKVNGVAPKGITFTGLALLKDFEPGDPETTVEVWEMIISKLRKAKETRKTSASPEMGSEKMGEQGDEMENLILKERIKALEEEKASLQRRVKALEETRAELTKRLGEAVIEHGAEPRTPEGYVKRNEVIRELRRAVFERVPRSWGYGPYMQNRRIKALIRRLEGKG